MDKLKDILELLERVIPLLAAYPVWVKILISLWLVLLAFIVVALLFFKTPSSEKITSKEKITSEVQAELARMMWKLENLRDPSQTERIQSLVMVVEVVFTNPQTTHAKAPQLEIALDRKEDFKQWRFTPEIFLTTYGDFIRNLGKADSLSAKAQVLDSSVIEGQFAPPIVDPNKSLTKTIVFAPPSGFPFVPDDIRQGEYSLKFHSIAGVKKTALRTVKFRLERDGLETLKKFEGFVVPTQE